MESWEVAGLFACKQGGSGFGLYGCCCCCTCDSTLASLDALMENGRFGESVLDGGVVESTDDFVTVEGAVVDVLVGVALD